jgi:hypothetical protein
VDFIVYSIPQKIWQGGQDLNLQPTVLETATLPIELPPFRIQPLAESDTSALAEVCGVVSEDIVQLALDGTIPNSAGIRLLGFPVVFVAAAEAAVFAELQPVGRVLFVFERVVVAALALGASHGYHHAVLFFCHLFVP